MRARLFRITITAAVALFGVATAALPAAASSAVANQVNVTESRELQAGGSPASQVVALTNAQRRAHGCRSLTVNGTLTAVAGAHSKDMAVRRFFDHVNPDGESPSDRIREAGYRYSRVAENIAAGYPTPRAVVTGWMNSPGHRANILNCRLTQIGVGYATGGKYGTYWTQNFGTPR